jgi:acetylglutamate kinase
MIFSNEELLKILPSGGPKLAEVQKYIDKYNEDYIVIKCGGSVLIDQILFDQLIEDISILNKLGLNIIVVHGGGKNIKKKLDETKLKSKFINGLRITDENTIKIVKEALTELNHEIINKLKDKNCEGISFSTNNNNVIKVVQINKELGFVGNPTKVNSSLILNEVKNKKVPIIVPMGLDENNNIFNINADITAGAIAKTISSRRLLLMTDVEGVLDIEKKLVPEINTKDAEKMINDQIINGGMIPKIKTCLDAINNGVTGVVIVDGRRSHSILFELFSDKGAGTLIRK